MKIYYFPEYINHSIIETYLITPNSIFCGDFWLSTWLKNEFWILHKKIQSKSEIIIDVIFLHKRKKNVIFFWYAVRIKAMTLFQFVWRTVKARLQFFWRLFNSWLFLTLECSSSRLQWNVWHVFKTLLLGRFWNLISCSKFSWNRSISIDLFSLLSVASCPTSRLL